MAGANAADDQDGGGDDGGSISVLPSTAMAVEVVVTFGGATKIGRQWCMVVKVMMVMVKAVKFMTMVMVMFQYDNVEGVTILLPADDQDISIQVLCSGWVHCMLLHTICTTIIAIQTRCNCKA